MSVPGWHQEPIHDRRADVFTPSQPAAGATIFLHGYSGESLKISAAYTAELERHRLVAVCPDGGKSWWLDEPTSEFPEESPGSYVLEHVLPWVEARTGFERPAVSLCGIGMGGQGALNLAYRHGRVFSVVAAVSPAIDFHQLHGRGTLLDEVFPDAEAARQQTAILHLHPLNWPEHQLICCDPRDPQWFDGAARLGSKLSSSGIPFEADLTTQAGATGWGWDYFDAQASRVVSFLAASR